MIFRKEYTNVSYRKLSDILNVAYEISGKTYAKLAEELKIDSVGSISMALKAPDQGVSDSLYSRIISVLDVNAYIIWTDGVRKYYVHSIHLQNKPTNGVVSHN